MSEEVGIKNYGQMPQMAQLPIGSLIVDDRYQRHIGSAGRRNIAHIVRHFQWSKFGIVIVTDNGDGSYCIIDGQHRVEALKQIEGIAVAPCVIVPELSLKEQSDVFFAINVKRVNLTPLQMFHSALRVGDARAVMMQKILESHGLHAPKSTPSWKSRPAGAVLCITALMRLLSADQGALESTVEVISSAYDRDIRGVKTALFQAAFDSLGAGADKDALRELIGSSAPDYWHDNAAKSKRLDGEASRATLRRVWLERLGSAV